MNLILEKLAFTNQSRQNIITELDKRIIKIKYTTDLFLADLQKKISSFVAKLENSMKVQTRPLGSLQISIVINDQYERSHTMIILDSNYVQ